MDPRRGGILYRPDLEPKELSNLVLESMADVDAMRARRQACSEYVRERFSLDQMAIEYEKVYTEARAAHRSQTPRARSKSVRVSLREWRRVNWSAAQSQYFAMLEFHRSGQRHLARLAAWESFLTLPLIYLPATSPHVSGCSLADLSSNHLRQQI